MMIGFAGLSHLGTVSSICAASRGFNLVCYDADEKLVQNLTDHKLHVFEKDLQELLNSSARQIKFTHNLEDLSPCDLVYISVDVQTDKDNNSSLAPLTKLIENVRAQIKPSGAIVILSQVPPGFTSKLSQTLDLKNVALYCQVETLIFGRAVERALYPERYIIGCKDPEKALPVALQALLESAKCPILPMKYESAELCKISINMFLAASVTVTNTLAEICEKVGADWSEIAPALKLDQRIGPHAYLAPGLGLSGGNIERDIATIRLLAQQNGTEANVAESFFSNSRHRKEWALRTLHEEVLSKNPKAKIGVLGIAYKQDTKSVKNSPSVEFMEALDGISLQVFDPQAELPQHLQNKNTKAFSSALEAVTGVDAVVLMTPWNEFRSFDVNQMSQKMTGKDIIDPFHLINIKGCEELNLRHLTLGKARS
jgi:UDPglucose 6-dehydrogenase